METAQSPALHFFVICFGCNGIELAVHLVILPFTAINFKIISQVRNLLSYCNSSFLNYAFIFESKEE